MNWTPIDGGSDMLGWAAQNAVVALVLAIVVAVVCRVGRLGPASRHALWLLVLVKLLTPSVVAWPWAIPILAGPEDVRVRRDVAEAPDLPRRDYVVSFEAITVSAPTRDEQALPAQGSAEIVSPAPAAPSSLGDGFAAAEIDWLLLIYRTWIAGALVAAGLYSVRMLRMHRLAKHATPAPDWLMNEVTRTAAALRIRSPRVAIADSLATPVVWSLGRATLLWPAGLVGVERAETWRGVIVHELAHLRRRDHWTGWLELVAGILWWFHPVYWYARHQMRENAELACDAWVVRMLPEGRRTYAEAILSVCEFGSPAVPPPAPALGVHSGARRSLERRLTMIMRERFPVRVSRGAWIAVAFLAVVAVPNWYLGAQAQPATGDAQPLVAPAATAEESSDSPPPAGTMPPVPHLSAAEEEASDDRSAQQPALGTEQFVEPDGTTYRVPRDRIKEIDGTRTFNVNDAVVVRGPSNSTGLAPPPRFQAAILDSPVLLRDEKPRPRASILDTLDRGERAKGGYQHVVDSDSFTLSRTTYIVPTNEMAERVREFLEQNLSWPHLMRVEVKEGGNDDRFPPEARLLIVTASPTAQEVIGGLIGLMIESTPRDSNFNPRPADPFQGAFGPEDEGNSDPFASTPAAE